MSDQTIDPSSSRKLRVAAYAFAVLASLSLATESARADVFNMCGHTIQTYYTSDGYVLIGSVSGVSFDHQRTDIKAWGQTAEGPIEPTPVLAAMYANIKFAWMFSRIAIDGYPDCNVVIH